MPTRSSPALASPRGGVEGGRPQDYLCLFLVAELPSLGCFSKVAGHGSSRRFSQHENCFLFKIFIPVNELNSEHGIPPFPFSHTMEIVTVRLEDV